MWLVCDQTVTGYHVLAPLWGYLGYCITILGGALLDLHRALLCPQLSWVIGGQRTINNSTCPGCRFHRLHPFLFFLSCNWEVLGHSRKWVAATCIRRQRPCHRCSWGTDTHIRVWSPSRKRRNRPWCRCLWGACAHVRLHNRNASGSNGRNDDKQRARESGGGGGGGVLWCEWEFSDRLHWGWAGEGLFGRGVGDTLEGDTGGGALGNNTSDICMYVRV